MNLLLQVERFKNGNGMLLSHCFMHEIIAIFGIRICKFRQSIICFLIQLVTFIKVGVKGVYVFYIRTISLKLMIPYKKSKRNYSHVTLII